MRCRLTPSVGTVVARSARSCRDIRVIKRDGRPRRDFVARVTAVVGGNVCCGFAACCGTVVARRAGTNYHTGMREECRSPAAEFVACVAALCRWQVSGGLPFGGGVVMAA